jgi:hypothetical protein
MKRSTLASSAAVRFCLVLAAPLLAAITMTKSGQPVSSDRASVPWPVRTRRQAEVGNAAPVMLIGVPRSV